MKRIFIMLVATLALTGGYAFGECTIADKKTLEAFDHAWSAAGEKGDRAALTSILADDYAGLPAMQTKTQSIDSTMRQFEYAKANPSTAQFVSDNYMISCTPASATITHRNVTTTRDAGGKEESSYTRSVHFLEKRGGNWQAVSSANHNLDDEGILMYMEHDWNNAYVKRDMAWFERNYASDYTSIGNSGRLDNKTTDIAGMKNDKTRIESGVSSGMRVRIEGNTAVVVGINSIKGFDENNKPLDYRLAFTDTFVKRDGRWQVWATQTTRIP